MKNFVRRIAVIVGAATVSVGLLGAVAPAHADDAPPPAARDSSWGR